MISYHSQDELQIYHCVASPSFSQGKRAVIKLGADAYGAEDGRYDGCSAHILQWMVSRVSNGRGFRDWKQGYILYLR